MSSLLSWFKKAQVTKEKKGSARNWLSMYNIATLLPTTSLVLSSSTPAPGKVPCQDQCDIYLPACSPSSSVQCSPNHRRPSGSIGQTETPVPSSDASGSSSDAVGSLASLGGPSSTTICSTLLSNQANGPNNASEGEAGKAELNAPGDASGPTGCLEFFCGSCPYDCLRDLRMQQMPHNTICLDYDQLQTLWRAEVYASRDVTRILSWLDNVGLRRPGLLLAQVFRDPDLASRTAFSIECCQATQSLEAAFKETLKECTHYLLQAGANVAMADFALDLVNELFEERFPPFFTAMHRDVSGLVDMRFCSATLGNAPNGQIAMLGSLSAEGKATIHTASSTRRPVLHPQASSFLRVLAVATNAGQPKAVDLVSITPQSGAWLPATCKEAKDTEGRLVGSPLIMVVDPDSLQYIQAEWRGHLVLFGAHFAEIKDIGGVDEDALCRMTRQLGGEEEVARFKESLSSAAPTQKYKKLQAQAYSCVQRSTQSKSISFSSS